VTKRLYCALLMAIATIIVITLLSSLRTGPTAAAAAAVAEHWAGQDAPVPPLHEAPVAELRQATSIDWRGCLAPPAGASPMTKEEFLQQKPARCSCGYVMLRACKLTPRAVLLMHRRADAQSFCNRLRLEHIKLTHLKSPAGITLVVAYDIARLHMLDGLCASWGGHISAAVYQVH
jgi:hypothetical protein